MQFSTTLILAAVAALGSAQNPFTFTSLTSITAGTPFNITWAPSTGTTDTVSLVLRQGESTDLDTVETIASNIQNTGSYLWTPSTSIVNNRRRQHRHRKLLQPILHLLHQHRDLRPLIHRLI